MQLYKGFDIGSAKPTAAERAQAAHHMIDFLDPEERFSVAEYQKRARVYIDKIFQSEMLPIVAGGSGLYVDSLLFDLDFSVKPANQDYRRELEAKPPGELYAMLEGKDKAAASRIHPNNRIKIIRALEIIENNGKPVPFGQSRRKTDAYEAVIIGLDRKREELYDRINRRVDILFDMGIVDEVNALKARGLSMEDISMQGIGYKEVYAHLNGDYDLERAIYLVKLNTRHFAKRQLTWFRKYDGIMWYTFSEDQDKNNDVYHEMLSTIKTRL